MEDVQPLLAQVVAALDSGVGENALAALDPGWNKGEVRMAYLKGYYKFLQGERITGLNNVSFRSRGGESTFVVNGVLNMKLAGAFDSTTSRDLHLKATFIRHKGKPALTKLEVASAKP